MPAPTIVVGAPCWNDLYSSDTDRAKAFYGGLFGWTTMDPGPEYGGYFLFQKDGKVVAGCMANDGEQGVPDMWTIYLSTDDADRTAEAAKANGGQVHMEPMDVTQNGRFTMLADPGGASIGAWQPRDVSGSRSAARPARPPGSSCTRATSTRASPSTATSSAGTRTRWATPTSSATRPSARARPRSPGSWTGPTTSRRASRLVGLLRGRRRRRDAREGRGARRHDRASRRGHALRPPRHRPRSDGDALPADGPEQRLEPPRGPRGRAAPSLVRWPIFSPNFP